MTSTSHRKSDGNRVGLQRFRAICIGLLGLILGWAGCVTPRLKPATTTLASDHVDLPTVVDPRYPFLCVLAEINGAGPYRLLVDTGASGLGLSPAVAAAANLKPLPKITVQASGAAGNVVPGVVALVDQFKAGGLALQGVVAYLINETDGANLKTYVDIDGFIGIAVFRDVILEMDFPRHQVSVERRGVTRYPPVAGLSYRGEIPIVSMQVAGKSFPAIFDTGYGGVIGLPLDAVPLQAPPTKGPGLGLALGVLAPAGESAQLAGEVRLGPVTWRDPILDAGRPRIGSGALSTWKIVFDQEEKKIFFIGPNLTRQWPVVK